MVDAIRHAWRVISVRERRGAAVLLALLLVATSLETVGIGLLVPLLGLLSDPEMLRRVPVVAGWLPDGELRVTASAALAVGLAVVAFYVVKAGYLAWVVRRQMAFTLESRPTSRGGSSRVTFRDPTPSMLARIHRP